MFKTVYNRSVMTDFSKAFWSSENDSVRLSMPIAKVDKEKRIVSGFATLDSIDKQADIVPSEVSMKAFERFRGNLREMHMPIAVGKVISFKAEKFYDEETGKFYNGVYVDTYISKGAKDTWEKVLDGTLSGFSIGGNIKEAEDIYNDDLNKSVRIIKEYDLHELSLVDNPANEHANIISIQKNDNGNYEAEGFLSKANIENVFYCSGEGLVRTSIDEESFCPSCEKSMENIGFVESTDGEKVSMLKSLISKFKTNKVSDEKSDKEEAIDKSIAENIEKEEKNMAEEITKNEEVSEEAAAPAEDAAVAEEVAPVEEAAPAEESAEEAPAEDSVEKSVDAEEKSSEEIVEKEATAPTDESNEQDLVKAFEEIKVSVADAVSELAETIKSLNTQVAEMKTSMNTVAEEVTAVKGNIEEFGKRVDSLEDDTAVRKSGDLGGVAEKTIKKGSMWGGRFLNAADLYR